MGRALLTIPLLLAAAGALDGCGKQETTGTGMADEPVAVNLDRPDPAASSSESTRGSELAELIQRDVDEYLKRRQGDGQLRSNQPTKPAGFRHPTTNDDAAVTPADERPFWEQPGRLNQTPPLDDRPEPAASITQRSGGVANNPLFRDPDALNVRPFPSAAHDGSADAPVGDQLSDHSLEHLLTSLRAELYQDASRSDMPLRELLVIAAMSMIDPERAIEPGAIPDLTDDERELLAKLQTFFARLGESLDGSRPSEEVIEEAVAGLRQNLLNLPQFQMLNAAFCWSVDTFGMYEEVPRYAFLAHSKQQVILYVEIDGFTSEKNVEGDWVTRISQKLTILTQADGVPVWQDDWRTSVDTSHEQRRDFYTTQIITLPEALSVGSYVMKVRLRDEANGAESEKSIPFTLVADPRMAASLK